MEKHTLAQAEQTTLFRIANLAIFTIGLGFAVRASIADNLRTEIFSQIDTLRAATMVGEALGMTFLGFALTLLIGSALLDLIGVRRMLMLSATANLGGCAAVLFAATLEPGVHCYYIILLGLLATGFGWGAIEAAINPLVVSLAPNHKTARLNAVHAWWPAGIVVGGVLGAALKSFGINWKYNLLVLCIPAIALLFYCLRYAFPVTERVQAGVSYADMWRELYRKPQFLLFWGCMWLTASTELAPGQWVDLSLTNTVGMSGLFILIYVSVLMFTLRHFATKFAHKISSMSLLMLSSCLAAIGLFGLAYARTPSTALLFATLWGTGVCFMWPTMLANVSERFPKGGAVMMGLMGFAGGLAIEILLPQLGKVFDQARIQAAGGVDQLNKLGAEQMKQVLQFASQESFMTIAYIPLVLIPIFAAIWIHDRRQSMKSSVQQTSEIVT